MSSSRGRRAPHPKVPGTKVEDRGAPLRTKPTTGDQGPRDAGPHGKTLTQPRHERRRAVADMLAAAMKRHQDEPAVPG